MSIWKKKEAFDQILYDNIDTFFEQLHGSKELEYRESQHTMALDIMDAIKNKEVLLIEAGVGSGKSWGYLVPLIYASMDQKKFKGFIISTSSIALQEQLETEIKRISEMLGTHIDTTVAKGRNNFICKRRLETFLKYGNNNEQYIDIVKKVDDNKVDRKDFDEVTQQVWKRINVDKVRCNNCMYNEDCAYVLQRKKWPTSKAVICNHDLLVEALKRDSQDKLLEEPSILIVDEAHSLEEKIRNSCQKSISKIALESLIFNIYNHLDESIDEEMPMLTTINQIFRMISTNAKREYKASSAIEVDVLDSEASGFNCTPTMRQKLRKLIVQLKDLEEYATKQSGLNHKLIEQVGQLKEVREIFTDLVELNKRKNIYWATFLPQTKEHIELQYVDKNIAKVANQLLNNPNYGKVFTSATMTTGKNDYGYFMRGLGLDNLLGIPVSQEYSQPSPYNYDKNALLYCATDVVSPKSKDHDLYLDSLTAKVEELIEASNGRSLVLFTSKNDMKEVYNRLQDKNHSFEILVQEDGKNTESLKARFKNDETSTLLATGSFWEGIDIKGSSLENVIITKLPFPVVNPIVQEKASHFTDGFEEVYLKEMLLKLKQGAGRLIRSKTDKGIVSILDVRAKDYLEPITTTLPFSNVTGDMGEVQEFIKTNLMPNKTQQAILLKK